MHREPATPTLYGLMAEFEDPNALTDAAKKTYASGYRKFDAYSPFPIEPVWEAMGVHDRPVSFFTLCGGLVGMVSGFGLCYWVSTIAYPLNIGGRPYNSWPAFTVSSFEVTVLFAVATAFFAFLLFCRLPLLYHPVFNAPDFDRASQDRYFLCVEANDAHYEPDRVRRLLERYGAARVSEVPT